MQDQKRSFPTVYNTINTSQLLEIFSAAPERLRKAIDGLTDDDLTAQPRPGKWSIKQIVFHLGDSDTVGFVRIKLAFAQTDALFPGYNQEAWVKAFDYQHKDRKTLDDVIRLFEMLRLFTGSIFRQATGPDWVKTGKHPEFGDMTLRNLLELYADHSERHIGQILDMRKLLGKEIKLPLMLEQRLY